MDEGAEFRAIIFNEEAARFRVFGNECVETAHRDVMDAHISIMTTPKFYLLCVVEIDDMQMLLALVFLLLLLLGVQLETFNDDVILLWLLDVEYLMVPLSVLEHIL